MKILTRLVLTGLLSAATISATAQHRNGEQQAGADTSGQGGMMNMMQSGTMQDMMQSNTMCNMHAAHMQIMSQAMDDPFKHAARLVRLLPTMTVDLDLSDEQAASFEGARQKYDEEFEAINKDIKSAKEQLKEVLASSEPNRIAIRTLLQETAIRQADLDLLGFEAVTLMRSQLTDEQRDQLAKMSPMQLHHHMMMNMSTFEMIGMMDNNMMVREMRGMM